MRRGAPLVGGVTLPQSSTRRPGSAIGQRAEHDGIDHAEDGGIGADAEGERERGDEW